MHVRREQAGPALAAVVEDALAAERARPCDDDAADERRLLELGLPPAAWRSALRRDILENVVTPALGALLARSVPSRAAPPDAGLRHVA